jgi:hypothetical protein
MRTESMVASIEPFSSDWRKLPRGGQGCAGADAGLAHIRDPRLLRALWRRMGEFAMVA